MNIPTMITVTDREANGAFSFAVEHLHSYFPEPLDPETARQRVPGTNVVILRPALMGNEDRSQAFVFGIRESYADFQALLARAGVPQFSLGPVPAAYAEAAIGNGQATSSGWVTP